MPVHDWTRVPAGTFHDFHTRWITHLTEALNAGLLPAGYYAQSEQRANDIVADVLTLKSPAPSPQPAGSSGGVAVAEAKPRVFKTIPATEALATCLKQRRLVVRHVSRHEVVAVIEVVSPANKDRPVTVESFVKKAVEAIYAGVHLLVVDLFPPGRFDPSGMHQAIWSYFGVDEAPPADKPLTVSSYDAGALTAYLEPIAIGDPLPTMPLFFATERYVNLPLEPSYEAAWRGVPSFWRDVIEGRGTPAGDLS